MKISGCTFVKNCFDGGWPVFEAIASVLHLVDEFVVLDMGSNDGTYEMLKDCAVNPKIKIHTSDWSCTDAKAFADAANDCVKLCEHDTILFLQSDEVFHENLVALLERKINEGEENLSFWRYHLRENAQLIRQFPQRVHRLGKKSAFNFVDDGMNTDKPNDAPLCSNFDGGWYMRWGDWFKNDPPCLPTWEMIMDGGLIGMFLDNVSKRKEMHQPFWRDGMDMPWWDDNGNEIRANHDHFLNFHKTNPNWTKNESPFKLPKIMLDLVGSTKYFIRDSVIKAIQTNRTKGLIGL